MCQGTRLNYCIWDVYRTAESKIASILVFEWPVTLGTSSTSVIVYNKELNIISSS